MTVCPECGGNIIQSTSEKYCEECGLVVEEDQIDRQPEWRAYSNEEYEEKSRVGSPMSQMKHDKGLSTTIGNSNVDANGNSIDYNKQRQIERMKKWHKRSQTKSSKERNLQFALTEIDRMASSLGIPDSTREQAASLYRTALNEDLIDGRSIEEIASSCLYITCRVNGKSRTLSEIADVSKVERKKINRSYRYLKDELDIPLSNIDPCELVPRFVNNLDLPKSVENEAIEIIEETRELASGKSPSAFAAGAIYIAANKQNEKHSQEEVAEAADVTKVTVRNRYKEQMEELNIST